MRRYVWGFPGVGKSSGVGIDGLRIVDVDAAAFQFLGVDTNKLHGFAEDSLSRGINPEFPENYLEYIQRVDADLVLINCHLGLLVDLDDVLVVYPDRHLKEEYLERYRKRGDNVSFVSYMEEEFDGIVSYLDSLPVSKIKITKNNVYFQNVIESEEFRMKVMTRKEIVEALQRAMDLKVVDVDMENHALVFDVVLAQEGAVERRINNAPVWATTVIEGDYSLDIDDLRKACDAREAEIEQERVMSERRGGLSREALEDKIMQGIVNGALGISYGQIAPYSHGYEVTFGGEGPVGATRDFKNRWECYCSFFDVPGKIADAIENGHQNGRVFGANAQPLDIGALLSAIEDMEGKKLQSFVLEKDTDFERHNYPYRRGSVATVQDVHAGKGLDGIVQHHYHGTYSTMTPSKYNSLVEMLVCMKGFCLDCLATLDVGAAEKQKITEYLQKQGIDISTTEKLRNWILENPEKCAMPDNREMAQRVAEDMKIEKAFEEAKIDRFGLSQEVYDDLQQRGWDDMDIRSAVADLGADVVERGYDVFTCSGSDVIVEGALVVEMIAELGMFEGDFEACRQAEKDGYKFINDIDGLEKGCYLDTPENRALCENWLQEHPEYRVENWLDVNSDYGKKYVAEFGPVISMKNWKVPLASQGMELYQKWTEMYNEAAKVGTLDGTSSLEENIKSVEDAAGWMLLTYEDTALEVIGGWRHDFVDDTCWGFTLSDIQIELEKCFGFERDFPTLVEIQQDYDRFVALSKDVRTPEQAIVFADKYHTLAEVNGDSARWFIEQRDKCAANGETVPEVEWFRYDNFGCLAFVYDYFDGKPFFDIYFYDGRQFVDGCRMEDLTEEKYEEIVDALREDFLKGRAREKMNAQGQVKNLIDSATLRAGEKLARGKEELRDLS